MKRNLFVLILALQTAWVLYTVATQEYGLASGQSILLETRPVDPRDLMRGDYLTLNYKISDVPLRLFSPPLTNNLNENETVYVVLAQHGQFHEVVRAGTNWLAPASGEVVLKGQSGWSWWGSTKQHTVHVNYGIERYYVPEGQGNPQGTLTVQAVAPNSHRATIKQVFVDGKPYAEAMKDQH